MLIPLKLSRGQDYAPIYRSLEQDTYYDQSPSESEKDEDLGLTNTKRYTVRFFFKDIYKF